jgi:Uma2 family endonuclease
MSAVLDHPKRHAVTVEEYFRMGEAGVFGPEARLELIEGEIIEMPPIGSPHAGAVKILNRLFTRQAGDLAVVSVQDPLILGARSAPQPDLALLKPRADSYSKSHPTVEDVLLAVEVADTTLAYDLGTKIPLYARSGVPEAWLLLVQERALRVFRDPAAEGYRTSFTVARGARVAAGALPGIEIAVSELFPE